MTNENTYIDFNYFIFNYPLCSVVRKTNRLGRGAPIGVLLIKLRRKDPQLRKNELNLSRGIFI